MQAVLPAWTRYQEYKRLQFRSGSLQAYNDHSMSRFPPIICFAACLVLTGCGYHMAGAASSLPSGLRTLSVPVFSTQTETYHTETVITDAVTREFASRTRFRVTPKLDPEADAVLRGTILKESVAPLTYNASTQESSSFLITIVVAVKLETREGKLLYENNDYVFREQYQSTTDLTTFLQENPAAVERLSRNFARGLVSDVLDGL
jgi:outer membrane lipopolysaccharide assembly protein LptE/RlpB